MKNGIHLRRDITLSLHDRVISEFMKTKEGTQTQEYIHNYYAKFIDDNEVDINIDIENQKIEIKKQGVIISFALTEISKKALGH